ncbi:hypothetical protein RGQ13_18380 [Thalassotalea psychrophila]|uniref:Uncharacterized protein n=1 Tax=Thalassotalea psychrophila TaxID=3065647 RepID=A0ABY9TTR7_9GAMM|nr:hypothetical protein RGQ13_18380 [Colwelliaceae bacterium SQ149]
MSIDIKQLLKNKVINEWHLFFLLSVPLSIIILFAMMASDLSTGAGVSHMIGYSVKWAIPFIYILVAASSVHTLFPSPFSMWLMRNQKYIGLCFAVMMAWQALFIFIVSTFLRDYYFEEIYLFRDELEGTIGYILLTAMVVTSFQLGRKFVDTMQWKLVHKVGVYFLWAYPFSVYWWNLTYAEPRAIDYIFYWAGFIAFVFRIAAWGKNRQQWSQTNMPESVTPIVFKLLGSALIICGCVASATGFYWQNSVTTFLTAPPWSAEFELWLPFWPLEPFLSIFSIALGTLFLTKINDSK